MNKFLQAMAIYRLLSNQDGFIRPFGPRILMEPKKEEGGGGGGETEEEKAARLAKEAADKKAADDKKKKDGDGDDELDLESLDPKVQKLIKSLRKEAGDNRVKSKEKDEKLNKVLAALGIKDDDEETPDVKISKLNQINESLSVRSAYLELAVEHGISKDQFDYFEFLMNKECSALKDDEELSEDSFEAILGKVKAASEKPGNTTSTDGKGGNPPPKKKDEVTIEQFRKMGMSEKTKLFQTNRELYDALMKQL